ncbi:MAG: LysM peptidoglycan-binding domain-containing protein [Anaerolineaceae bacterium]|jgi:LysM repeat protein/ribosomal protein L40E|nr:LysM peptidoglycan-binding domain-containing protein [Anaerolineaceae bacterium]
MNTENISSTTKNTKICPTCGTRLSENATRCLVCGQTFDKDETTAAPAATKKQKPEPAVREARMPELTLSLPVAIGLVIIMLAIGAAIVFGVLRGTGRVTEPTETPTVTLTPTLTLTPTEAPTSTPMPSPTPLPPLEYTVSEGDYCSTIAAIFNVSIQSIVLANNLPADCGTLYVGQVLLVPQPTPTASPLPTSTLSGIDATREACEKYEYVVSANDTLSGIAGSFNVSMAAIKEWNGLVGDVVYQGQPLTIPLCQRNPTPGPTPTATLPPPYQAPNLLLPADGEAFTAVNNTITLQWASVGTLRDGEAYGVTMEDVTDGTGRKQTSYVTDTKFIVPSAFRPAGNTPHIIRWWVVPVRQAGTTREGEPRWENYGDPSEERVFSWFGGAPVSTPAP